MLRGLDERQLRMLKAEVMRPPHAACWLSRPLTPALCAPEPPVCCPACFQAKTEHWRWRVQVRAAIPDIHAVIDRAAAGRQPTRPFAPPPTSCRLAISAGGGDQGGSSSVSTAPAAPACVTADIVNMGSA